MESYIEVSVVTSFLLILCSCTTAFYIAWKPQAFYKLVVYAILIPMFACFCFDTYGWLWMVLLEGFFFWWIFAYAWRTWLIMIAMRLLWNFTCYVAFEGSFHLGIYFVPKEVLPWFLWAFLILILVLLIHKWKVALSQRDFIYPIELMSTKTCIKLRGYLDTGNLLCNEHVPVMFVDHKYEAYFVNERIELVVMNTMHCAKVIRCYEAFVKVGNGTIHKVLVNSERTLQLPMGCNALLNMNMMTQE